jgi:circadian clock protein KaiC
MPKSGVARASTGVAGLDAMLRGGLRAGDSTLVVGSPGTGKTTLGMQFVAAGIEQGEPAVFVTFEYLPQQIYLDAERKGYPFREWEQKGLLRLVCTTPEILLAADAEGPSVLREAVHEIGARRLVIDSMAHFELSDQDPKKLRQQISGLLNHSRLLSVTTLLTHEVAQIVGPSVRLSDWGLEFLVDNVIMLRYVEFDGQLQKAINVLKFRSGDHDRHYRLLQLGERGMSVEAEMKGIENISAGAAHRTFLKRAQELI